MGYSTAAGGDYSTATGFNTSAGSYAELAIGANNTRVFNSRTEWVDTDRLFVIGNGRSDVDRSDAMVVLKNGYVGLGVRFPSYQLELSADRAAKPGTNTWTVASDERLKDIAGPYQSAGLAAIAALQPVRFHYKPDNARGYDPQLEYVGFIAQAVCEVIPEAVSEAPDGYLDFDMHAVNVALVNAVKELKAQNEVQQARIDALEAENALLAVLQDLAQEQQAQIAALQQDNAELRAMQARLSILEAGMALRELADGTATTAPR